MFKGRVRQAVVGVILTGVAAMSIATTAWMAGGIARDLGDRETGPWILARASGFTSYLLVLLLVVMGLVLSHPSAARLTWPSPATRLRIHVSLAVFSLVFTVLHVFVLATDPWAHVGWRGALLPMASDYRPVAVTLGVIALWSGLLTGLTASLAGRLAGRIWWPIHKVAAVVFVLIWAHGFWSGIDTPSVTGFYLATGALVLALGVSRYSAATPADLVADLVSSDRARPGVRDRVAP